MEGKVQRINLLLVSVQDAEDPFLCDVPDLRNSKLSVCSWQLTMHTLICLSSAPVASSLPFGLKHTLRIYISPGLPADLSSRTLPNDLAKIEQCDHVAHQVLAPVLVS